MDIVPALKLKKKQQPAPVEAVSKVLVRPNPWIRLLARLFADVSLRRTEAVVARTEDTIDDLTGRSFMVHRKGDKDRVGPLSTALENELKRCRKGVYLSRSTRGALVWRYGVPTGERCYRLTIGQENRVPTLQQDAEASNTHAVTDTRIFINSVPVTALPPSSHANDCYH